MQPFVLDEIVVRFKRNHIVDFLLRRYVGGLNELADMPFSREDWDQFYQLIGYSLDGYHECSLVSQKAKDAAQRAAITQETS